MKEPDFSIAMLTKYCNEALILSMLITGKKHGYQLALEIEEKSSGYFKFNHGTLYPILHKLEKEELLKGLWRQEGPRRKRKYYKITSKGRKYFGMRQVQWKGFIERLTSIIGDKEK